MELTLLQPATVNNSAAINLQGHLLQTVTLPEGEWTKQPYTCVSFAWGEAKMPNPLAPVFHMSARALPVLETAIKSLGHITESGAGFALWMDTFCMPNDEELKQLYLGRMGDIYAQAAQVIVVLSTRLQPLLQAIRNETAIPDELLLLLNNDEWVTRAWPYQEIVNSGSLYFVAEGENEAPIKGHVFFDAIANAIEPFCKAMGYDAYTQQAKLPGLTAFEAVVLDWRLAEYTERSAYQVMTNMCYRSSYQPDGLINAMIGCIADNQPAREASALSPAELFMQVCEAKGDFSFIYATAARSTDAHTTWRPADGSFRPVLPWLYCFGEGQVGKIQPEGLELQKMCLFAPHIIAADVVENTMRIMRYNGEAPVGEPIEHILSCMRKIGFTGCGQAIELEKGYFFPQEQIDDVSDIQVLVATGIHWTFGAPGLLVKPLGNGTYQYQGVGVFAGQSGKGEETVVIQ
jgi:Heterokaryon incompatibility protein (HET)